MKQDRYNELAGIGMISKNQENLYPYISKKAKERQKQNKQSSDQTKKWIIDWIKYGRMIHNICMKEKQFEDYFKIDAKIIKDRVDNLEKTYNKQIFDKRSSPNKEIYFFISSIVLQLYDNDISRKEIIDFIYKYFCDNSFDDYNNDFKDSDSSYIKDIKKVRKDRIRKEFVEPVLN